MLHPTISARAAAGSLRHRVAAVVAPLTTALVLAVAPSPATLPAQAAAGTGNPLSARPWGIDTRHELWKAYEAATGDTKRLLGKMALKPTVFWFTDIAPVDDVERRVADYVESAQDGNPDTLVQLAMFRLWPEGEANRDKPLTLADRRAYRRWVDNAARGIGDARVAMVLEPDLAVALTGWRPEVRLGLARYAAKKFSALPRTTVYLDAGSSDWLSVPSAVKMLRAAGIGYARGFSLGATHYTSTASEIAYGTKLVKALRSAGFGGRRFVIDTADSGRPFTYQQYYAKHPNGFFDNAEVCRTRSERRCVTLGIPPTTAVAATRWGLPARQRTQARAYVDGYLWFSRPWYYYARAAGEVRLGGPFDLLRALSVARTSRY
ncbi:MAG TPA: glycoside hydrolase family 6 protein [Nocardioidaceae bacterium]|nr:glycoside hydrolase family 6 protein [Nocardioidaceae bacterium]